MSEGYTGISNGIYYKNGTPICAVSQMGNLSPNQQKLVSMPDLEPKKQEPAPKKKVVRRRKKTSTTKAQKSTMKTEPDRTPRPLPASSAQPRDHLGRFASKAGSLLWGATKATAVGTARAVVGTVKVGRSVHKGIQTHQKQQKRRANLEQRERAVAVTQQEIQLGMRSKSKKKKVVRRRKR